jgi:tetratricopeptide (TPR) repeat protein
MMHLARQQYDDAAAVFADLRGQGVDDAAIRYNQAYAEALRGAFQESLILLDDTALAASSEGPTLKIRVMYSLGLFDDALATGEHLAARYPDDAGLMGALATLALDAQRLDLARHYAQRAEKNPESRTALGLLALGEYDTEKSLGLFDGVIDEQPDNARAWLGKGLALLGAEQNAAAAPTLEHCAKLFGTHLGSWIAAGWAYFTIGDLRKARENFEAAEAVDPNFSETHGGLAVIDITEGRLDSAEKRCEVALRLDRKSFGGILAKSLLLDKSGNIKDAQRIREIALSTSIGPNGETIANAMLALGRRKKS